MFFGRIKALLLAILFLIALAACADRSGSRPPPPQPPIVMSPCPLAAPGVDVPLSVLVMTNSDGDGNPLWTAAYLTQILASASTIVARPGFFVLDRRQEYNSDILFPWEQAPLALALCPGMPPDQFTILISQPNTTVSAGETPVTSGAIPGSCFVMRSRHVTATPEAIDATARILVHELGHVVGYSHEPVGPDGVHADNWWTFPEGQERLTQFQAKITRRCGK